MFHPYPGCSVSKRAIPGRLCAFRLLPARGMTLSLALMLMLGVFSGTALAQPANGLLREVFLNIGGGGVSDLLASPRYPNQPDQSDYLTDFETPSDVFDNYGMRVRGYLVPPVTGNYTFWIATDDGGALFLSTDETVGNRRQIATVNGWTPARDWEREPNQKSAPIALEAGRIYYVDALMKEGGGGDNLAVRWLRPDGIDEGPIPAKSLFPWGVTFKKPTIARSPLNTSVVEGGVARFDVQMDPLGPGRFRWRRNDVDLAGATNAVLLYGPVTLADDNTRYRVFVTNTLGTALSSEGVLRVTPDVTPPTLVRLLNLGTSTLLLIFSEAVRVPAVAGTAFALDGGVTATGVVAGTTPDTLVVTVTPMTFGQQYNLQINGVTDRASTPNPILPGTSTRFRALEYSPESIGGTAVAGSIEGVGSGAFNLTGGGGQIGRTADQFQYAWEQRTGNFDVQVRVEGVSITDPFVHAGLMARDGLSTNNRFAAVFASSPQAGSFFEARSSTGANSTVTTVGSGFPANYPQTWLRLRRVGNVFTGFGSFDAQSWVQLGTVTITGMPSSLQFGLVVASLQPAMAATARFRDLGPTLQTATTTYTPDRELPGPFVRSTGLVLSEIHYHPAGGAAGAGLEFVELYNGGTHFEDLDGMRLSGEINYTFPVGTRLEAGDLLVVAANPTQLRATYGITNVVGPFTGRLSNSGGTVRLRSARNDVLFEVNYGADYPWPIAADGAGTSIVLVKPSYGPSDPRAWAASDRMGGSPGRLEMRSVNPWRDLVINEWLAHTDEPQLDFVELHNRSASDLDLSGCILTDDASTNRFRFPAGTTLGARGFLAVNQDQLGFRLNAAGESLYLISPDGSRVIDAIRFAAQENGVSSGRQPDGAPEQRRLATLTPGAANGSWRPEPVVITELMYNPISGDDDDEYLELYNRSAAPLNLSGWRFTAGIDLTLPNGVSLAPGGRFVVAKNIARLRSRHPHLTPANSVGDYSGTLSNGGERVALSMPDAVLSTNATGVVTSNTILIDVAEVTYDDGGRWGTWADGGGSSLELIDVNADPRRPSNWADSDETAKGEWTTVAVTGSLDNGNGGYPPDQLQVTIQGGGEALVDDVEVIRLGTSVNLVSNNGFEAGTGSGATGWTFQGNHTSSFIQTGGAATGNRSLHIRSQGRGDTGFNRIRTRLAAGLGDGNQATIRARVRWVVGWPEVLFRIRGNWLELPARLTVPNNLGTPGLANSRAVANAGPAIWEATHRPVLPAANQLVTVTARVSDPDGIADVRLVGRVDGVGTSVTVILRDDGSFPDAAPGDGVFSGNIPGRAAGTMIAFRMEARDSAGTPVTTRFPADAPARECLVRWGEPIPIGSFGHYHLWSTTATESARSQTSPLNNLYRDATLVFGDQRVIYNAGFKDKGSPFHGGAGDFFVITPEDDSLLGTTDIALASTGNGGNEDSNLREQMSFWIARQMGSSYLNRRYVRLYRNGGLHRDVSEDSEEPNGAYAERFYSEGIEPDLYKIEDWFEFQDDGTSFSNVDATLQPFYSPVNSTTLKPARYRWAWRKRAVERSANEFTNLLELVTIANAPGNTYESGVSQLVDVDQWMRVFAFQRIAGNWDSYGMGRGKNMYAFKQTGAPWRLFPWDVDFTLGGGGNGPTDGLWGAGDPTINRMFDTPAFRRLLWQAYIDAVNGPLMPGAAGDQIDARNRVLLNNGVASANADAVKHYIAVRRATILSQLAANDVASLEITSNGGANLTVNTSSVTLTGRAPLGVRTIEINGAPFPVRWTGFTDWQIVVPLAQSINQLNLVGLDPYGRPVAGATDSIRVTTTGTILRLQDFVVINEILYDPAQPGSGFIELFNQSPSTPFDLSGLRLEGVGYTFPEGAVIGPASYVVLASNAAAFADAFGSTIPVLGVFPGGLDNDCERLSLVRPDPTGGNNDMILQTVRYSDRLPWPTNAGGFGPSLQLVDPRRSVHRLANWAATATNDLNRVTPGRANSVRRDLSEIPELWLNEVLPNNVGGPLDNAGEREPFIEIHNSGTNTSDLSNVFLSASYTNLIQWRFPNGTSLAPGQFIRVWADGETTETVSGHLHAGFRLDPIRGVVALSRSQSGGIGVLDHVDYSGLSPDRSLGLYPDGNGFNRRVFFNATPGAANDPAVPNVRVSINEFVASNSAGLRDPVDNDFDDWIELYNSGTTPVDLASYRLTDNLTNSTQFVIPPGYVIPPGGFLLVWADNEPGQNATPNGELHVNFRLSGDGEQVGLFDPNGRLIDGLTFGVQTANVSVGRFPDGGGEPTTAFQVATPRRPNFISSANRPPVLPVITAKQVDEMTLLAFDVVASDPDVGQKLTYSLVDPPGGATIDSVSGRFLWTPGEAQGPAVVDIFVRVTDDGVPARFAQQSVTITVNEVNRAPTVSAPAEITVDEGATISFSAVASDPDQPAQVLAFSLVSPPAGASIDPVSGAFRWATSEADGWRMVDVRVRVTDSGLPPASTDTVVRLFVREIDSAPVIALVAPQTLDEGSELVVTNRAVDPDGPGGSIHFSLGPGAPSGMTLNPETGVLRWIPGEADGPGQLVVTVRAEQTTGLPLSDSTSIGITVREVNQAPGLTAPVEVTASEGTVLRFTATGSDNDLPRQTLTYTLLDGAPVTASMDPLTGEFGWAVPTDAGASTRRVTVRVRDGAEGLSAEREVVLVTQPRFRVVINEVMYRPLVARAEYVELHNPSAITPWDISGNRLEGLGLVYQFPAGTILAPRGFVCVVRDVAAFRTAYGASPVVVGPWTGALGGLGDHLRLLAPDGLMRDEVRFGSTLPWPIAAAGGGASLQLIAPDLDNRRPGNWSATTVFSGPQTLVTFTNEWRYFQTGAQTADWRSNAFNDLSWAGGRGLLFVENAALPAATNTPLVIGQSTYYFRTTFDVPAVPGSPTLTLRTILDDGTVVYLNGREVFRQNMDPEATVDFTTFANTTVPDAGISEAFTLPTDALLAGRNVVAVEVHQANAGSSDLVWGGELVLNGASQPSFTPGAPNNVSGSGADLPPVFLSEAVPNNTSGLRDAAGDLEPWVEIANLGPDAVSLEGWWLSDSTGRPARWAFPAGSSLAPGEHRVIFADNEPSEASASEWHASFRLAASDGLVLLSGPGPLGVVAADLLVYGSTDPNLAYANAGLGIFGATVPSLPTPGLPNTIMPNRPPVFTAVSPLSVAVGSTLIRTLEAADPDFPPQSLTFAHLSGPDGATVSSVGVLQWAPTEAQVGRHLIQVEVRDSGSPPLAASTHVTVDVVRPVPLLISIRGESDGITLTWPSTVGMRYRLETVLALGSEWIQVRDVTGGSGASTSTVVAPGGESLRLYRLRVLP